MAEGNTLSVEIVAEDRFVWSGEARFISARTVEGDIGVLPGHTPLLAVLGDGDVVVETPEGEKVNVEASGGFFSVDNNRVTIAAGNAKLQGSAEA